MNADLTFNSVVFKKSFDDQSKSLRQSSARGVTTPDVLTITGTPYVSQETKVPGKRYLARIDSSVVGADGKLAVVTAYVVLAIPSTAPQSQIDSTVATFKAMIADASFIGAVLNAER